MKKEWFVTCIVTENWHIKWKINWERTFKRLHNWVIYRKDCFFFDPVKKFRRSHQRCSIKKLFLQIQQYSQEITCVGVSFHLCWSPCNFIKSRLPHRSFPVNIADILTTSFLKNTSRHLPLEVESENISHWWLYYSLRKE